MDVSFDIVGTLRAQPYGHQALVLHKIYCIENHPADSRVSIRTDGICQTLTSRMGTGGGNCPMVMEEWIMATGQANSEIMEGGVQR